MTPWNTSSLRRFARREWGPPFWTVRDALVREKWRAIPMTIGAVCLTSVFQIVQNTSWGFQPVQNLGSVKAADPLWLAVLRTPLSLFVPALDLPVWGALAQILLVFGISEICIGWWRTLLVGYVATLAGTTYARIGLSVSPDHPFGLPLSDRIVNDTGPSAAVVGLAMYVCWRYRAYVTGALVILVMIGEVLVKDNLAGKEHLAAIAAVMVMCAVRAKWGPRHSRVPLGRRPSPLPPCPPATPPPPRA
uniref:Integral membrane protein n=1 Tax=Streptomyces sp. NBC_00049 TaxID=2903617 RepID=A0AAU2JL69_9ACTN